MAITDLLLTNQGTSTSTGAINNTSDPVTFSVASGDGNLKFPAITGSQYFKVVVANPDGTYEIMKCTSRTGDALTCTRAQEGTTKISFSSGAVVSVRFTAGDVADILSRIGWTTFAGTLLDDANAAAARATLGVKSLEDVGFSVYQSSVVTGLATSAWARVTSPWSFLERYDYGARFNQTNRQLEPGGASVWLVWARAAFTGSSGGGLPNGAIMGLSLSRYDTVATTYSRDVYQTMANGAAFNSTVLVAGFIQFTSANEVGIFEVYCNTASFEIASLSWGGMQVK